MSTPTTTCILQGALTLSNSSDTPLLQPQPYSMSSSLPNTTILLSSPTNPSSTSTLATDEPQTCVTVPVPEQPQPTRDDIFAWPSASYGALHSSRPPRPTQKSVLPPPAPSAAPPYSPVTPVSDRVASPPSRGAEASPLLPTTAPEATADQTPAASAWDTLKSSYLWPRLLLLLVAAVWGTNFPTVKILQTAPDALSASNAAFARFVLATVALLPFTVSELRSAGSPPPRSLFGRSLLSGVPVFIGYLTQAVALTRTDAGKCAFMCSLAVVVVPLLTRLFPALEPVRDDGEAEQKSKLSVYGAPILAVAGVALLELAGASPPNVGDAWAGAQAIGFAIGFLVNEGLARDYAAYPLTLTTVQLASVALLSAAWAVGEASLAAGTLSWPAVHGAFSTVTNFSAVVYAGVVSTALTLWITMRALRRVTAGELAVLLSTEPMWAAAFAAVALDERMGFGAVVGGAFILLACVVNQADALGLGDWGTQQQTRFADAVRWARRGSDGSRR